MSDDLRVFVRDEEPDDHARVFEVTEAAFEDAPTARLNDELRREVSPYLSQVANGFLLPFVLVFMLRLINRTDLMGEFTNSRVYNFIIRATIGILVLLTASLAVLRVWEAR